ncbi:MAG: redox-sensing transcriptional repressor Rex, partial [Clostridiales bacterium]|nr:redox-sensing transcriptional repressor Rex [Clostridiales bacterium]
PEGFIVENVHLAESLMQLSYALTARERENKETQEEKEK